MDLNNYRNCINNLINWEWSTLKHFRRKRRRNIILRVFFALFSLVSILVCVFSPPFILGSLLTAIGLSSSIVNWTRMIGLFVWIWFISPMDKLSKKERDVKNKRKLELVKTIDKVREFYDNKFK